MNTELNEFLRFLKVEKGFSKNTVEAYRMDLERSLFPFLQEKGINELEQIKKQDIRTYMDYLVDSKLNSNAARARKLAVIKSFFKYLVENDILKTNPASSIRAPKIPYKEPVYLNNEESLRFLEAILQKACSPVRERDLAICFLFLHTGIRVSELTNLKVADIDLNAGQLKIVRKGGREQYIHLNHEVIHALREHLDQNMISNDGYLFCGMEGRELNRINIYEMVRKYLKLAGINKEKQGPHILRHTFCTRLHQMGVGPFVIKELAGHRDLNTTMRYINIETKEKVEAVDRLQTKNFNSLMAHGSGSDRKRSLINWIKGRLHFNVSKNHPAEVLVR